MSALLWLIVSWLTVTEPTLVSGRCSECLRLGVLSQVDMGTCTSTLMAGRSYYDEAGTYHYDDPNTPSCSFRCTNGHDGSWALPK